MPNKFSYIIILIAFLQFSELLKGQESKVISLHPELYLTELSPHVYMHTSVIKLENGRKFPCNGLIYIYGGEVIIFDTPVNDSLSMILVTWIEDSMSFEIKGLVVNHYHNDCMGGLKFMHEHGIKSYASFKTISIAKKKELPVPHHGFEIALNLRLGQRIITNRYFGPAHSQDNIVSYLPDENLLFGGCMIRTPAVGKGNLEDASVESWHSSVDRILRAFPKVEVVVPGHGEPGGRELLYYTIDLFHN